MGLGLVAFLGGCLMTIWGGAGTGCTAVMGGEGGDGVVSVLGGRPPGDWLGIWRQAGAR